MTHPGTAALCRMLAGAGHQALFVGGCVRNGLIGAPVDDIDIATDARPEAVMDLAAGAGMKPVPTGVEHGTVTVVAQGRPHEVTTFRKDVESFGRHAVVAYSDDIADDAARRDFTMNALYARPDGEVLDPVGEGLDDLAARRLRFIGLPEDRIREDYLRILRFFRFHAWYADPEGGMDAEGLAACATLSGGLETLSKERIGGEIRKLLTAPDPARAVAAMARSGILAHVLPGATADVLPVLLDRESLIGLAPDPVRRLAALNPPDAAARLRLSKAEARRLDLLVHETGGRRGPGELGYRHGAGPARDILALRAAALGRPLSAEDLTEIDRGARARFPVRAADLMPEVEGPALGERLRRIEDRWIASGFTLGRDDLLS